MAVEEISLYRFSCEGEPCKHREGGTVKSPAMPGVDEVEAVKPLSALGWIIPLRQERLEYGSPDDFTDILCPTCANDEESRADVEFNQRVGFGSTTNRSDAHYDPGERRLWNKLTIAERRALHPSKLGRVATSDDVREVLSARGVQC